MANQKFTSIKNEYAIVFDKNSTIEIVPDDQSIKPQGFCFNTVSEISEFD